MYTRHSIFAVALILMQASLKQLKHLSLPTRCTRRNLHKMRSIWYSKLKINKIIKIKTKDLEKQLSVDRDQW
uniref:Putative secreted peptide n=1 Tax=Anopheles braziliensis TaxID=58242 RepID=A0A2M3ZUQ9_9DIPT